MPTMGLNPESEFYLNGHEVKDRWGLTPQKIFINMSQPSARPKGGVCDFWGCRGGWGGTGAEGAGGNLTPLQENS